MRIHPRYFFAIATNALVTTTLAAQTVSLSLDSPENGDTVMPGAAIHWAIQFSVSSDDNAGLALLVVDFAQASANPAKFDIPPANGVPPALTNFSCPAGISNRGESNPATGYTGVQRGSAGEKNLRQIGGAQNTFGEARPAGSDAAENAIVSAGVGHAGTMTLASGTFTAPTTPGVYVYQLENPVANVLSLVNPPPQHSPVDRATVNLTAGTMAFTVSDVPCESCDVNCDGQSDGRDLQWFVEALTTWSPSACSPCAGDLNGSGDVTVADIAPFVACLLGA